MSRASMASLPFCRNCLNPEVSGSKCPLCGHDITKDYVNIDTLADDDVIVEMSIGQITYEEYVMHQRFFKGTPESSMHIIRFNGQNECVLLPPSYYGKTVLKAGKQYEVTIEKKEKNRITHVNKGVVEIPKNEHSYAIQLEEDLYVEKKLFSQNFKKAIKLRDV